MRGKVKPDPQRKAQNAAHQDSKTQPQSSETSTRPTEAPELQRKAQCLELLTLGWWCLGGAGEGL